MTADVHEDADNADGLAFAVDAGTAPESRDRDRWAACLARVVHHGPPPPRSRCRAPRRHRDVLVALGAGDTDVAVHAELVRLGAGFLDQGQAHTVLPARERGFLGSVAALAAAGAPAPRACRGVERDMARVAAGTLDARGAIDESLAALGVGGDAVEPVAARDRPRPARLDRDVRATRAPPGGPRRRSTGAPRRVPGRAAAARAPRRGAVGGGVRTPARMAGPRRAGAVAAVPAPVAASRLWHLSLTTPSGRRRRSPR